MNGLSQLFGNGQQQSELQDFANRFNQGSPTEGYSDQEAVQRYQQVAPNLPPQEYQASAEQAFERLSPEQRMQLGQELVASAQQQGVNLRQQPQPSSFQNPGGLAQLVTGLHQQQPGLLPQLLGGGGSGGQGSILSSPIAKVALAGIAAMAAQRYLGGRR